jgi:DNA invertase Pin-like site-specific DNA recombinase
MSKIGYVRVSTIEQNTKRQEVMMEELGVDRIYIDKCSGKDTDRPQLKKMMDFAREGDTIIVESFSRLARSTKDLLELVEIMGKNGVTFVSLKESIDTSTSNGKFMMTVFSAMAELERDQILQRQREGIAVAKAEGKYKGRQPIKVGDAFFAVTKLWTEGQISLAEAQKTLNMAPATFFRKCKKYGISKARV